MIDELIARLRATTLISKDPDYTLYVDGVESRCNGAETHMIRNPDGPEAADALVQQAARIAALTTALHDAINRPKGVVPASADPFYEPVRAALQSPGRCLMPRRSP